MITDSKLSALINEKDQPCISIIIPTQRAGKRENMEILKKAVLEAKATLENKSYPKATKNLISAKIDKALRELPRYVLDGLGIFISPKNSDIVPFPFPVKQKITVADNFESRDLFYLKQYASPYYVLTLTTTTTRLFLAETNAMTEIKDGNFPFRITDEYEYAYPSRGSSYSNSLVSFEKDKGTVERIRLKSAIIDIDNYLSRYLAEPESNLVVASTKKMACEFEKDSRFSMHIIGHAYGIFTDKNFTDLANSAWFTFIHFKKHKIDQDILKLDEQYPQFAVGGIDHVWKAAQEDKGLLLMVEKDFRCKAYLKENNPHLFLTPPTGQYKIIEDAVDDVIETIYKKNGEVVFTEAGQLRKYDGIALMLRY